MAIELSIASLTGKHISLEVEEVYVETDDGVVGVLERHQPEFYSVGAGVVTYRDVEGNEGKTIVYDGFVQIEPDAVRIAVRDIMKASEIDVEKLKSEIETLRSRMESLTEEEYEKASEIEREIEKRESLISKAS